MACYEQDSDHPTSYFTIACCHWEVHNSGVGSTFCSNPCLSMLTVANLLQN